MSALSLQLSFRPHERIIEVMAIFFENIVKEVFIPSKQILLVLY
jgi:hypothetical protein